ncbi:MAG TPA: hypothetical protein PLU87_09625 [Sedimentisphaerales bacterium]|nr:hypothetical protein [Sedimentisphaerales bacterium]HRS11378.1 hypothetical protein [Sedimentisphaerales bacterium]HRV47950.1 hypothetical protein [Sedimentisphaerales bacterium]
MWKSSAASSKKEALYIVFLAMIAAVPAMATDMYLAAMPTIASQWTVPDSQVGLSLAGQRRQSKDQTSECKNEEVIRRRRIPPF